MDAKQACDKLNGFNFQNRYLVGELGLWNHTSRPRFKADEIPSDSTIPPAREDGPLERGPRRETRELRTPQTAARDRITFFVHCLLVQVFVTLGIDLLEALLRSSCLVHHGRVLGLWRSI